VESILSASKYEDNVDPRQQSSGMTLGVDARYILGLAHPSIARPIDQSESLTEIKGFNVGRTLKGAYNSHVTPNLFI
jgi:hypothetical protein